MNKSQKIVFGITGLGLLFVAFRNRESVSKEDINTGVDSILDETDTKKVFSDLQIKTIVKQIRESNEEPQRHIQVRTWKGLIQLDLENQFSEKKELSIDKMQEISRGIETAISKTFKIPNNHISAYCRANGYQITNRINLVELNLIKLANALK